ncbi:hypothetical protein [Bacillus atrophaeus]|uniref:hypothetical protein n=1 Tax=Bacillus atrophaeus TaxID=1452 RepID=UPI00227DBBD9|nr:hypothetical protein [Bacillus atrophaeus]MCY8513807.1 hypothetical protein [Bacillus atrophaeus]MCY8990651.1 hypothetical protein [Bacillus atrophaeus]
METTNSDFLPVEPNKLNPFEEIEQLLLMLNNANETLKNTDPEFFDKDDLEKLITFADEIKLSSTEVFSCLNKGG